MRNFLLMKMVCASCGGNLTINYNEKKFTGQYVEGEPTGADMVHQVVAIEPCECTTRPLHEMRNTVKILFDMEKQNDTTTL